MADDVPGELSPPAPDADLLGTDVVLEDGVRRHVGERVAPEHAEILLARLADLGRDAGSPRSLRWAELADLNPPRLRTHDPYGRRVDEVEFHPVWHRLLQSGVRGGLGGWAWAAQRRAASEPAGAAAHTVRAAGVVLWAQADVNHLAPCSSTYALLPALSAETDVHALWAPRLESKAYESGLRTPADKLGCLAGIAVTERRAGTDVRTSATTAHPASGGALEAGHGYRLTGQKWFVSSPMSDVFLVLAQAPQGLTAFLVPRVLCDGTRNTWRLLRLKDKPGNRASASAEVELDGTWGVRLGEEGEGSAVLDVATRFLRLDAVLAGAGLIRHGVVRAVHHCRHRTVSDSPLSDKPLMQNVLADLAVESEAATLLGLRLAAAVDAGEEDLLRAAVPVAKFWVGKRATPAVAEALECLGGNGYVEEHGMARVFRDSLVTAVGQGPGNLDALDVLRAVTVAPRCMEALLAEVDRARGADARLDRAMDEVAGFVQAAAREARRDPAAVEGGARWMVERVAVVLQASLLVRHAPEPVSSSFLATRVAGGGGCLFGTLPVGRRTTAAIIERALPL